MSTRQWENILLRAIQILIGCAFFVPLIVIPDSFIFPFVILKIFTFRSIVLLMAALYVPLLLMNPERYRIRFGPIAISVLLFFGSFLVSGLLGEDSHRSFWDNHERMLGTFTIAHYAVFFLITTHIFRSWDEWRWAIRSFLFAGSIVMGIAIHQKLINPDFLVNGGSARVMSTLGNAIYVGGYGMFLFFLSIFLLTKERELPWRLYTILTAILGVTGLFFSGTRGAFLGFVAGIGVLVLGCAIGMREHRRVRQGALATLALGVLLFGVAFVNRERPFVQEMPIVGTLLNINIESGTANTRLLAWGIAIDAWKEFPVFGWGPNNYFYAFNKYYRPEFLRSGYTETWFDNAHNATLNMFATNGAVGLVIYLGLFLAPIWFLWKGVRMKKASIYMALFGSAFLVSHYVQQFFVFENPTSYLYFFFTLAFLSWYLTEQGLFGGPKEIAVSTKTETQLTQPGPLLAIMLVGAAIFIFFTNIQPARANHATLLTFRSIYKGLPDGMEKYATALAIPTPHDDDIRLDFSRAVADVFPLLIQDGRTEQGRTLLDAAYAALDENRTIHPRDVRYHFQQAQLSLFAFNAFGEVSSLERAERALEDALVYSPNRQQFLYTLVAPKFLLKKNNEAIALLEKARDLDPTIPETWWRLALLYKNIGDQDKAIAVLTEAYEKNVPFGGHDLEMAENILPRPTTGTQD